VVRSTSVQDIRGLSGLPFTTRSAWIQIQSECPDLRRTHAHLKQGTRPSKKITNIKDVKRYLNVASIAKDGLLVVHRQTPLSSSNDLIIVPRTVLDGHTHKTRPPFEASTTTSHETPVLCSRHASSNRPRL
jgi:hypothetical protein